MNVFFPKGQHQLLNPTSAAAWKQLHPTENKRMDIFSAELPRIFRMDTGALRFHIKWGRQGTLYLCTETALEAEMAHCSFIQYHTQSIQSNGGEYYQHHTQRRGHRHSLFWLKGIVFSHTSKFLILVYFIEGRSEIRPDPKLQHDSPNCFLLGPNKWHITVCELSNSLELFNRLDKKIFYLGIHIAANNFIL